MTMNSIMKNLLREYGLIIILIVVSMVGYLVVRSNEEEILARSLDGISERLVVVVDDAASRRQSTEPLLASQMDSVLEVVGIDSVRARVLRRLSPK